MELSGQRMVFAVGQSWSGTNSKQQNHPLEIAFHKGVRDVQRKGQRPVRERG